MGSRSTDGSLSDRRSDSGSGERQPGLGRDDERLGLHERAVGRLKALE